MTAIPAPTPKQPPRALRVYTFLFHAGWILIVLAAAWRRFALPLEPLTDRDVWGYLSPALLKLTGGPFIQSEGRGFLYPGFIYLTLTAFRSLNTVTIIQHVFGLGTGLLLLLNWTTARRFLSRPLIPAALHDLIGLGLLAIFLLCAQSIFAEHHLRPEGILPFFTMLGLWCTIRFLLAKHIDAEPRRALWFGAASLAVSFLLPLFKPSYSLTAVLTTLPVWWHLFDRREQWRKRLAMAGVPVLAAWLLLWAPENRYAAADPRTQVFLSASLFTIHAPQIREQLAADVEHPSTDVPYSHEQLQAILQSLDTEIELSRPSVRHGFSPLGFNPDYLLYEDSFCHKLASILPERARRAGFYHFYFRRTWEHQPGAMLRKFSAQLGLFYNLDCPVYTQKSAHFDRNYRDTYEFLFHSDRHTHIERVPAAAAYLASLPELAERHSEVIQPSVLKKVLPFFARTYLLGMVLAIAAAAWLLVRPDLRAACGQFVPIVALGYAYNLGNNLAIALFHTLGVGRYAHVQLVTTLLTQALSFLLVMEVVAEEVNRLRRPPAAPSAQS